MSPDLGPEQRESVEARWTAAPWWQEGLVAAALILVAGPLAAFWLRNQFPSTPVVPIAALLLFWLIGAEGLYKRARGHIGRFECPECGATIGSSKGSSLPGKRVADAECARCGVRLTYPRTD